VNVYFHTFGCKANQYDTALVRQAFADQASSSWTTRPSQTSRS